MRNKAAIFERNYITTTKKCRLVSSLITINEKKKSEKRFPHRGPERRVDGYMNNNERGNKAGIMKGRAGLDAV